MRYNIKKLQNNFTTPEQSKRLLELGVPADSADMFYSAPTGKYPTIKAFAYGHIPHRESIPCWSVGRLMKIFIICTPYVEITLRTRFIEKLIASYEDVIKHGLIDFSKLED